MTRKKNASFQGVRWSDALPNAATFRRAIENVIGDIALIKDKLTGLNSETNTINHSGGGRGAVIRHKLVNQHFGRPRSLRLTNPLASGNGGYNTFAIVAVPIFIPVGVDAVDVWLYGDFTLDTEPRAIIHSSASYGTPIDSQPMEAVTLAPGGGRATTIAARLTGLTASSLHILYVTMRITNETINQAAGSLKSWAVEAVCGSATLFVPPLNEGSGHLVRAPGTTGSIIGVNVRDYHSEYFDTEEPINGYMVSGANVDLAGLYEYATGWPAGGNAYANLPSYTHEDQDSGGTADAVNPARSRFFANTKANYSNEPNIDWPMVCVALGAIGTDGAFAVDPSGGGVDPAEGMLEHCPLIPVDTSLTTLHELLINWPDFDTGALLYGAVLLGSNGSSNVGNWTMRFRATDTPGGGALTDDLGTTTALDASNDFWLATARCSIFDSPDAHDVLALRSERSGTKAATDEVCVLGYCLWFEV